MSINIEWIGHACFRVWRPGGPVIVMDPYTPSEVKVKDENEIIDGDIVLLSSLDDKAHSNPKLVRGDPQIVNALELAVTGNQTRIDGSPVIAVEAAESPLFTIADLRETTLCTPCGWEAYGSCTWVIWATGCHLKSWRLLKVVVIYSWPSWVSSIPFR